MRIWTITAFGVGGRQCGYVPEDHFLGLCWVKGSGRSAEPEEAAHTGSRRIIAFGIRSQSTTGNPEDEGMVTGKQKSILITNDVS